MAASWSPHHTIIPSYRYHHDDVAVNAQLGTGWSNRLSISMPSWFELGFGLWSLVRWWPSSGCTLVAGLKTRQEVFWDKTGLFFRGRKILSCLQEIRRAREKQILSCLNRGWAGWQETRQYFCSAGPAILETRHHSFLAAGGQTLKGPIRIG